MTNGRSTLLTTIFLATIWWLLSDQQTSSWLIGIPTVGFAIWVASRLQSSPDSTFSWIALLRLLPLFFRESIQGGLTVAVRVLSPRLVVHPTLVDFHSTLQQPAARVFFIVCVNLLPGTLIARHNGAHLTAHLLEADSDALDGMRNLEQAVARIFDNQQPVETCR